MSTLNVSNISDGTDTVETGYVVNGSAKAWVNFDGGDMNNKDSLNVSSLTDEGTGIYTTTLSNAFTNSNYAYVVSSTNFHSTLNSGSKTAGSFRHGIFGSSHTVQDSGQVTAAAFGDLA